MTPSGGGSRLPTSVLVVGVVCVAALGVLAYLWYFPPTSGVSLPIAQDQGHSDTVTLMDTDFTPDYWTNNSTEINYLVTSVCYPVANPKIGCAPNTTGYLVTPDCPNTPNGCANLLPGSWFDYNMTLIDIGNASHTIQSIVILEPFGLLGVSPALPYTMPLGLPGTNFTLLVRAPSSGGIYDLAGVVNCV